MYKRQAGNLALKYKLTLNGVTGDSELLDVIKFSVVGENEVAIDLDTFEGELKNGELSGALYIQGHMDEAAGNEYQGKSLEGLSLTVVATQDTVENDSFNNEYDKNATYPVASASELKTALTTGGIISVTKDIETNNITDTADARMVIANPTTLNLDKKIISPKMCIRDRHRTLHRVLSRPDRRRHILRSAAASTSGRSSVISLTIRINKIYKSAMLYMK